MCFVDPRVSGPPLFNPLNRIQNLPQKQGKPPGSYNDLGEGDDEFAVDYHQPVDKADSEGSLAASRQSRPSPPPQLPLEEEPSGYGNGPVQKSGKLQKLPAPRPPKQNHKSSPGNPKRTQATSVSRQRRPPPTTKKPTPSTTTTTTPPTTSPRVIPAALRRPPHEQPSQSQKIISQGPRLKTTSAPRHAPRAGPQRVPSQHAPVFQSRFPQSPPNPYHGHVPPHDLPPPPYHQGTATHLLPPPPFPTGQRPIGQQHAPQVSSPFRFPPPQSLPLRLPPIPQRQHIRLPPAPQRLPIRFFPVPQHLPVRIPLSPQLIPLTPLPNRPHFHHGPPLLQQRFPESPIPSQPDQGGYVYNRPKNPLLLPGEEGFGFGQNSEENKPPPPTPPFQPKPEFGKTFKLVWKWLL